MVTPADRATRTRSVTDGRVSSWWHAALALVLVVAFVTQIALIVTGGADANAGGTEERVATVTRLVRMFSYFTIQSNLLVLAAACTLALNPRRDGAGWRVLRTDALLGIVITGLVYALVLAGDVELTGVAVLLDLAFHVVAPWMAVLGWVLFGPRPRLDWRTFGLAFVWPVAWIAYTFAHGAVSDWYPYPFLDVNELGYGTALLNTGVVVVIGAVIALLLKAFDRLPTIDR